MGRKLVKKVIKKIRLGPEHTIDRRLTLVGIDAIPSGTIGVYCLYFGDCFYIGKSTNVRRRLLDHESLINRALRKTVHNIRLTNNEELYCNVVAHLMCNKHITTMTAKLLYKATSEIDALREEARWFSLLKNEESYLCLNSLDNMRLGSQESM